MSDQNTEEMNGKRPFEDRIFDRVQKLGISAYDTKPIWEEALKEIIETKREIVETRRELSKRLDRIEAMALETRADLRDAEDRLDKIEPKLAQ